MTAVANQPLSLNLQTSLNFKMVLKRAPAVSFLAQEVKLPDIGLPAAQAPSPSLYVPLMGDHLMFEKFDITFKVDDNFQNWLEIFNWMMAIGNPDNNDPAFQTLFKNQMTGASPYGQYSDFQVFALDASSNPSIIFNFQHAWPNYLSGLSFKSTSPDITYMNAAATFYYLKYWPSLP